MFEELDPQTAAQYLSDNQIILIDVRNPVEFALERIRGSFNAPLNTFDPARLPNDPHRSVVLICGSGVRSAMAAKQCLESGMTSIAHVRGGVGAWKQAKQETIAVNPMTGNLTV